jgi:hypothetical protein
MNVVCPAVCPAINLFTWSCLFPQKEHLTVLALPPIRSDLLELDPSTLSIRKTVPIRGQINDLVGDDTWLWASVFSRADQRDRLLRIDPSTGIVDQPIEINSLDISKYNPPDSAPVSVAADIFATQLEEMVFEMSPDVIGGVQVGVTNKESQLSVALTSQGPSREWTCQFSVENLELTETVARRLAETLLATYLAQWDQGSAID